jgi:hypothetical protein
MPLRLRALLDEGRFIFSDSRPDAVVTLPPLVYGDVVPVELSAYRRSQHDRSALYAVDLTGYDIRLAVGPPNARPSLGYWYLTWNAAVSMPIPADATAAQVLALLSFMTPLTTAGGVTVTGDPGDLVISFKLPGEQSAATVTFEGATTVTATLTALSNGDTSTPAQWRVQLMESAPAGITPDAWTSGSTTPASAVSGSGQIWSLVLDPAATSGFFTLTANGTTTAYLSLFSTTLQIQTALEMINAPCLVMDRKTGGLLIAFSASTTLTIHDSQLQIVPTKTAFLNLSTPGIRELLDGASFIPAELTVTLSDESQQVTSAIMAVMLKMPVATPAASTIPIYQRTAFQPIAAYTGANSLESVPTARGAVLTGNVAFTVVSGVWHTWQLQDGTNATDAANGYVRPSDYDASTNIRVWVQIN